MTQHAEQALLRTLDEMKSYVGFDARDHAHLRALHPQAAATVEDMIRQFYEVIDAHPGASRVFDGVDASRARLHATLKVWALECLQGPWDMEYLAKRRAIGQAHVRHRLPQRYMLLAMNVVRRWMVSLAFDSAPDRETLQATVAAIDKVLDIELAVMLGTYRDDLVAQMQRKERLATIGELAANIHHELKNPLAAIDASLFALADRRAMRADPRAARFLERARANTSRASDIITDLLSFARLRSPSIQPTPANALVGSAVDRVRLPPTCRLTLDLDPALPPVAVDGAQIEQVLVNVLENAVDAVDDGGAVRVTSRLGDGFVRVDVSDDGAGIAPDDLAHAFEPLFSTKPEGIGLGLSLSRNLIEANHGSITLTSAPGEGTTATLLLPTA